MEAPFPPRKIDGHLRQILAGVVERLIPHRWRDELPGNLAECASLPPHRYVLRAADYVVLGIASGLRKALLVSPIFEPNKMGLAITVLGYIASLYKTPVGVPLHTNRDDLLFGIISGVAVTFWIHSPLGRSLWVAAMFVVLAALQLCLVLLNLFPGQLPNLSFGGWGITLTLLALAAAFVDLQILPRRNRNDRR